MSLRLAGEEFSVVRGLDTLGWPREVEAYDADPGLKITQSGSGPALRVVSGDIALGANKLKTTNMLLKEVYEAFLGVRNAADSAFGDMYLRSVYFTTSLQSEAYTGIIAAYNGDNNAIAFQARDSGVGLVEVARLQGAADPYFQATLPVVLKPSGQPGTPVEGHLWYDSTAKKLKFYNGTAVEIVTSA